MAITDPYRRRTLQGGFGRPTLGDGQPNVRGAGIMQGFLGANPVGGFGSRGGFGGLPRTGGRGVRPGGRNVIPRRGRGGGVGGGRLNRLNRGGLGLPLDAVYEGDRRMARDALQAQMTQLRNARQVGLAGLAEEEMLGNRQIDENMASRGLYGSGVEKRDERLLGNDIARSKMDLLSQFTSGRSGAQMDFRRSMQEALLNLGRRNQNNRFLPKGRGRKAGAKKKKPPPRGKAGGRPVGGRSIPRGGRRGYPGRAGGRPIGRR